MFCVVVVSGSGVLAASAAEHRMPSSLESGERLIRAFYAVPEIHNLFTLIVGDLSMFSTPTQTSPSQRL